MDRKHIESLEQRQLLTAATDDVIETAFRAPRSAAETHQGVQDPAAKANLTTAEVETILGRAASQARPGQVIVVMDDEGITLGIVSMTGADDQIAPDGSAYPTGLDEGDFLITTAAARARTGAFFQSNENAFTTRTARFIIQDHFPHPVRNSPGGPLYGVQFSSYRGGDVVRDEQSGFPALSGDPGGIPIYKNGIKCGGIGVAGDGRDIAARPELVPFGVPGSNPRGRSWQGREESDFDEAVALAGVRTDFATPSRIRATNIFVDGLRFPFTRNRPAKAQATRTLAQITGAGQAQLVGSALMLKPDAAIRASTPPPFVRATFGGVEGYLKRQFEVDANGNKIAVPNTLAAQIVDSNDTNTGGALLPESQRLTEADVSRILDQGAGTGINIRALIREPDGVGARVHISVVDRDGDLLASFRMDDGPNFGYDVSVQKARTAAFFSDDNHAISTRALGFTSQKFFPIGIQNNSPGSGPFFEIQDRLTLTGVLSGPFRSVNFRPLVGNANNVRNPLRNGITIFAGGIPLYKNGIMVGAIGISGDGIDQDEEIAFGGSVGFHPESSRGIRSDQLNDQDAIDHLTGRVQRIVDLYNLSLDTTLTPTDLFDVIPVTRFTDPANGVNNFELSGEETLPQRFRDRMEKSFSDFRLPYLRFGRNSERFERNGR